MKTNLFLMDMASAWSVNGVMRFIQELAEALATNTEYRIIWVRFIHQLTDSSTHELTEGIRYVILSLPNDLHTFLNNREIRTSIWENAYRNIKEIMQENERNILHVHTLNLMDFALYVRERIPCKIVSHIHCIPWKGLYNNHEKQFNLLYEKFYIKQDYSKPEYFIFRDYERKTYELSDCIVCVTKCAENFIRSLCPNAIDNTKVVTNAIKDIGIKHSYNTRKGPVRCLFVGNSTRSKGLDLILQSLNIVNWHHDVALTVAGTYSKENQRIYHAQYPFLYIQFVGKVSMLKLMDLYVHADIGLIASLQEQCSYVAIEMMMFGLPIVTTDVDGLGEIFTNKVNALTVPTRFQQSKGLRVNINEMAHAIQLLIENPILRRNIGTNARKQYKLRHSIQMLAKEMGYIYAKL